MRDLVPLAGGDILQVVSILVLLDVDERPARYNLNNLLIGVSILVLLDVDERRETYVPHFVQRGSFNPCSPGCR